MVKTVGYTRLTRREAAGDHQVAALRAAGCALIFSDICPSRRNLRHALAEVSHGDTFMVYCVDELSLPRQRLLEMITQLLLWETMFTSLTDPDVAAQLNHEVWGPGSGREDMAANWFNERDTGATDMSLLSIQPPIVKGSLAREMHDPRIPQTLQLELSRLPRIGWRLARFCEVHGLQSLDDAYNLLREDRWHVFGDGLGRASISALMKLFFDYGYDIKSLKLSGSFDSLFPES